MGEIRIVGPGKTRGYPYTVCKKKYLSWVYNEVDRKIRHSGSLFGITRPASLGKPRDADQ